MRRTAILAIVALLASMLAVASPLSAAVPEGFKAGDRANRPSGNVSSDFRLRSPDDVVQVFIQFDEPAVAELAATGAPGAAQRAQSNRVLAQQRQMRSTLSGVIVEELSDMQVAANGLRVMVRAGDIPSIRAMKGVLGVTGVTRYHLDADTIDNRDSVPWIGGDQVEDAGYSGDGVTIAIIDTGIDYTHDSFGGPATVEAYENNDPEIIEPDSFPTGKVIDGWDFAGTLYDASDPDISTPNPDPDPLDVHGHGTHVAATAAGYGNSNLYHGMAQGARLVALKVFGDNAGSTDLVADALEWALDPNNDGDTTDHVDVVNMSLGSDYGVLNDPSSIATDNAVALGIVVVASSGNAGSNPYITGSPAVADGAISVAASIDEGFVLNAITVNSPEGIAGDYEAAIGSFGTLETPLTDNLALTQPLNACAPLTNAAAVTGNIALLVRGDCDFTVKLLNAQEAGAVGAVVINNVAGAPIIMGQNGDAEQPVIPGVMITAADGNIIAPVAQSGTVNVTLSEETTIPQPQLADNMASFSSRGPGHGNGFKPDVSAPGFGIDSAGVGTGDGAASMSGTSMAAPHIAGMAAQVLSKYPNLEPAQVKALIMNSARPAAPDDVPLAWQGTGVAQANVAVLDLEGFASPGGISFGRINPLEAGSASETITVTRLEGNATYNVEFIAHGSLDGVDLDVPSTLTTSGGTGSFDITLSWDPSEMPADLWDWDNTEFDGWVKLTNQTESADTMVVGVIAVMDPASDISASGGEASVEIANGGADGYALGYNLAGEGDGGLIQALGYTVWDSGDGYDVLEFGLGLEAVEVLNPYEIDILLDVDDDGLDDYAVVAADLGLLTGTGEFNGQYVTALFDLNLGGALLEYFVPADFNDESAVMLVDLTGDFGINPTGTEMSADVFIFDLRDDTVAGVLEDLTIDVSDLAITELGNFIEVPAGEEGELEVDGSGEMLWLFPNNQVGSQYDTTTVAEAPGPEPGARFIDVPANHLFNLEIEWLAEEDITRGCNPPTNTMFCPDGTVSRGQMAAFLVRALDLPWSAEDHFDDDNGHLFEAEINALAEAGITKGCNPPDNTNFCPDRQLSRAEMATFMQRAFTLGASATDWFDDDDGNIHEEAINALAEADITRGCNPPDNTNFCPNMNITRGQMAAFLYRAFHQD